jgi:hypothetical protein
MNIYFFNTKDVSLSFQKWEGRKRGREGGREENISYKIQELKQASNI